MKELLETYQFGGFTSNLVRTSLEEATEAGDFLVADEHTAPLLAVEPDFILRSGEPHKTLVQVEELIEAFTQRRLVRSSTVLAFGGGVLCDLTGFATATYMRGCNLVLVPTTLLSMVDAGLGGKTGCNYRNYKNMIGSFYPAREVRIVPEVLASLPAHEFRSGLAELCKHSLLSKSPTLWHTLRAQHLQAPILSTGGERQAALDLCDLLLEGVRVKGDIVQRDLYEHGERAFLNLGHTYGHALEKVSSFACSHGEAVAWGINQALQFGVAQGYCGLDYAAEVAELLNHLGFELRLKKLCSWSKDPAHLCNELLAAMELDKKRSQSGICLILQRARAQTFIGEFPAQNILEALQQNA